MEGIGAAVGPCELLCSVIRGKHNNRVVSYSEVIELLKQFTHDPISFLHPIGVKT